MLPVKLVSQNQNNTAAILTLTLCLSLPLDKARNMARVLLKHGATSAQAETSGYTALHRFIRGKRLDLVDELLETDKTGATTALNHLIISGWSYNSQATSALQLAIKAKDTILVMKLLNLGAKAVIDFETWLKAAKAAPQFSNHLRDLSRNKQQHAQVEQPILTAIASGYPDVAIELLNRGADPNTLNPQSAQMLLNEYEKQWSRGVTVLDITRQNIEALASHVEKGMALTEPKEAQGLDEYLNGTTTGTYKHWCISSAVESEKRRHKNWQKHLKEEEARLQEIGGFELKEAAITELISGLKSLESALLAKGAKTFSELHPGYNGNTKQWGKWKINDNISNQNKPNPFEYRFTFNDDGDLMTDQRTSGYIEL